MTRHVVAIVVLVLFGIASLCAATHAFLAFPVMKMTTGEAVAGIERDVVDLSALSDDDRNRFEMYANLIRGNQQVTYDCLFRVRRIGIYGFLAAAVAFWAFAVYLWRSSRKHPAG